jgi:hypothetical protein
LAANIGRSSRNSRGGNDVVLSCGCVSGLRGVDVFSLNSYKLSIHMEKMDMVEGVGEIASSYQR